MKYLIIILTALIFSKTDIKVDKKKSNSKLTNQLSNKSTLTSQSQDKSKNQRSLIESVNTTSADKLPGRREPFSF